MLVNPKEQIGLKDSLRKMLGKEPLDSSLRLELSTLELKEIIEIKQTLNTPGWKSIQRLAMEEIEQHEKQVISLTPDQRATRIMLIGHWAIAQALRVWLLKIESSVKKEDKLQKEINELDERVHREKNTPKNSFGRLIKKNIGN